MKLFPLVLYMYPINLIVCSIVVVYNNNDNNNNNNVLYIYIYIYIYNNIYNIYNNVL